MLTTDKQHRHQHTCFSCKTSRCDPAVELALNSPASSAQHLAFDCAETASVFLFSITSLYFVTRSASNTFSAADILQPRWRFFLSISVYTKITIYTITPMQHSVDGSDVSTSALQPTANQIRRFNSLLLW